MAYAISAWTKSKNVISINAIFGMNALTVKKKKKRSRKMKITLALLEKLDACEDAKKEFVENNLEDIEADELIKKMIEAGGEKLEWASWLLSRIMTEKNRQRYAVFAAELVLPNFETVYPDDKRPHEAIEAAKVVIKNYTIENRIRTNRAYKAAYSAYNRAYNAAYKAAYKAAYSAYIAAYGAVYKACGAYSAADNAYNAYSATLLKIIQYGLKLYLEQKGVEK